MRWLRKISLKTWMGRSQSCKDHREKCLSQREQHVLRPKIEKKADVGGASYMSRRAVGDAAGEIGRARLLRTLETL